MSSFKELARVTVAPNRDIIISEVIEKDEIKGININSYITTEKYTGFTKGTYIPLESIVEFKAVVAGILRA